MAEEVLFKFEQSMDRSEIAAYLRTVADRLEAGDDLSLAADGQDVALSPPDRPTFEVKAERETSSSGGSPELSVEFELEWTDGDESQAGNGDLTIE